MILFTRSILHNPISIMATDKDSAKVELDTLNVLVDGYLGDPYDSNTYIATPITNLTIQVQPHNAGKKVNRLWIKGVRSAMVADDSEITINGDSVEGMWGERYATPDKRYNCFYGTFPDTEGDTWTIGLADFFAEVYEIMLMQELVDFDEGIDNPDWDEAPGLEGTSIPGVQYMTPVDLDKGAGANMLLDNTVVTFRKETEGLKQKWDVMTTFQSLERRNKLREMQWKYSEFVCMPNFEVFPHWCFNALFEGGISSDYSTGFKPYIQVSEYEDLPRETVHAGIAAGTELSASHRISADMDRTQRKLRITLTAGDMGSTEDIEAVSGAFGFSGFVSGEPQETGLADFSKAITIAFRNGDFENVTIQVDFIEVAESPTGEPRFTRFEVNDMNEIVKDDMDNPIVSDTYSENPNFQEEFASKTQIGGYTVSFRLCEA